MKKLLSLSLILSCIGFVSSASACNPDIVQDIAQDIKSYNKRINILLRNSDSSENLEALKLAIGVALVEAENSNKMADLLLEFCGE